MNYREGYFGENDDGTMTSMERDHEKLSIKQSLIGLSRQIGDLTSIVRALTEKSSSSKEGNHQDVLNSETRSDTYYLRVTNVKNDIFSSLERVNMQITCDQSQICYLPALVSFNKIFVPSHIWYQNIFYRHCFSGFSFLA